jgi:hypothetical protein
MLGIREFRLPADVVANAEWMPSLLTPQRRPTFANQPFAAPIPITSSSIPGMTRQLSHHLTIAGNDGGGMKKGPMMDKESKGSNANDVDVLNVNEMVNRNSVELAR